MPQVTELIGNVILDADRGVFLPVGDSNSISGASQDSESG
jgi:hypothetical protein